MNTIERQQARMNIGLQNTQKYLFPIKNFLKCQKMHLTKHSLLYFYIFSGRTQSSLFKHAQQGQIIVILK